MAMRILQHYFIPAEILMCGCYFFAGGVIQRLYALWRLQPIAALNRLGTWPECLGNLTYSSYLLHFPILLVFIAATDIAGLPREVYYQWPVWLAYFGSVFIAAHVVYVWFERPCQDAIRSALLEPPNPTMSPQRA